MISVHFKDTIMLACVIIKVTIIVSRVIYAYLM
jgi:hypothetical protein